jgi:hypothetical protein
MTFAAVELSRTPGGVHNVTVVTPGGKPVTFSLERAGASPAIIQWADFNLNREPADDYKKLVEHCLHVAAYHQGDHDLTEPTQMLLDAFARLKAERDHWHSNHDEMVARNAVLRRRPDLPQECGHPKQCIGNVGDEQQCLWCADIKAEAERTDAAVKDALADNGDSYRDHLYEDQRHIVPTTGEPEPGASVTIYWKPIPGEVGGRTVDHGYVFVFPHEDEEVGACVHIPNPDPRGDRDVSPEWPTLNDLLANILIERIEFKPPDQELKDQVHGLADWLWQGLASTPQEAASRLYALAGVTGDGAQRLQSVDERYAREVKLIQYLAREGVLTIRRGILAERLQWADQQLRKEAA